LHAGNSIEVDTVMEAILPTRIRLRQLRGSIDNLDAALVHLLAERFKYTHEIGRLKVSNGLPLADSEREARQIARLHGIAQEAGLDPSFAEQLLRFVFEEVVRRHGAIGRRSRAED
jgi:chorismate mutase